MCDDASSQSMSESEFRGALALCDELIASLDASWRSRPFRWFRPPQGYMASHMKRALAELGYSCALALCDELIASLDASWRSRPFR